MQQKYNRIKVATMKTLIDTVSQKFKKRIALSTFEDELSEISYSKLIFYVKSIAIALQEKGMKKGDKAVILGESSQNWALAYFAITYFGGIAVSILPNFSKEEVDKIVEHSQATFVFADSANIYKIQDQPIVKIRLDDLHFLPEANFADLKSKLTKKEALNLPGLDSSRTKLTSKQLKMVEEAQVDEQDLASIIYTSGTTGTPKGVMLTHKNIIWNADICSVEFLKIKKGWKFLSILPLSHVYEFTLGLILPLLCGCQVVYLGRPATSSVLIPAFKKVRPQFLLTVPILIEKTYRRAVLPEIEKSPRIQRLLKNPLTKNFVYHSIGRMIKQKYGGKVEFFGIGGSALDKEVEKFLFQTTFPYAIGYGLTETSPMVAGCGPQSKNHKLGCIGKIVPTIQIKFSEENEILIKGDGVMKGYYRNEELTKEVFTEDGFFKSGDLGYLNKHNLLVINGRSKAMILGSNGENIFPEQIEGIINNQKFVQESLVIPENGGLLALIKIDLEAYAQNFKLNINDARTDADKYVKKLRENINLQLNPSLRINQTELQDEPFERTPTMKIKRYLHIDQRKKGNKENKDIKDKTE